MTSTLVTPQELAAPGRAMCKYVRTPHADGHVDYERWRLDDVRADPARSYFVSGSVSPPMDGLAELPSWSHSFDVATMAPTVPGVYMFRSRATSKVVYVGMAGEHSGAGLRGKT